ncbi:MULTISPECIES: hypothetical protein [unclassified Rhodococcus (in: high G+C Gram-positive bacteria)]|uniref:hypothetical protein n=1 Tax=unclassified Rhodococcus (in: high G+C Gram-positive bacteria) TaxID=192944 RepID=UPI00163B45F0|nr:MULTISPECIES: hypothetical protein [unclassified Rhodococcus (in: high G+C Gram-positive bacteria)]MBC2639029.1 hypothetical protein [Rhodococcus sp. 3A]MBC2896229.1 hypothetical protein [Rhodococcus sp. 4CII]
MDDRTVAVGALAIATVSAVSGLMIGAAGGAFGSRGPAVVPPPLTSEGLQAAGTYQAEPAKTTFQVFVPPTPTWQMAELTTPRAVTLTTEPAPVTTAPPPAPSTTTTAPPPPPVRTTIVPPPIATVAPVTTPVTHAPVITTTEETMSTTEVTTPRIAAAPPVTTTTTTRPVITIPPITTRPRGW